MESCDGCHGDKSGKNPAMKNVISRARPTPPPAGAAGSGSGSGGGGSSSGSGSGEPSTLPRP